MSYLVKKKLPLLALQCTDLLLSVLHKKTSFGKIEKLLLCNIAHLGDVVIATTVLPVLKAALPHLKIGFLCSSSSSCVLQEHPEISWLHTVDHWKLNRTHTSKGKKALTYYATKTRAIDEVRNIGYDVAIDLYPFFPNAIPLLWRTKIPVRIGYKSGGFGPLLTHAIDWEDQHQYMADSHFELLKQLPVEISRENLRYSLPSNNFCDQWGLEEGFFLFHMGSGSIQKNWSESAWRELAMSIKGRQIVFTGKGLEENQCIQRITLGLSHCLNLCDQLVWKDFCSVVSKAGQIVGVDSAIVHLAAAFAVPCLVIIVDSSNDSTLWSPLGTRRIVHPEVKDVLEAIFKPDLIPVDHREI